MILEKANWSQITKKLRLCINTLYTDIAVNKQCNSFFFNDKYLCYVFAIYPEIKELHYSSYYVTSTSMSSYPPV